MTDNEIIKALECCILSECENCPHDEETACKENLNHEILDLINRQKAEINKLTYQVNRLKKYDEERDIRLHARLTATAKAEAIKECLDKVKGQICCIPQHHFTLLEVYEVIRKTEKEMVGEG